MGVIYRFPKNKEKLRAKLTQHNGRKIELKTKEETDKVLSELSDTYRVRDITRKERKKAAKPPFITSTLQQEASTKFNFNSKRTMMVAQKLYEGIELASERVGLITYMRTDSIRLSDQFIGEAKIGFSKISARNISRVTIGPIRGKRSRTPTRRSDRPPCGTRPSPSRNS